MLQRKKGHVKDTWQIQEAKANFSKLINSLDFEGVQKITKQGEEVAVVMSIKEYEKLVRPKTTLIEFFENSPLGDLDLENERSRDEMRDIDL